MEAVRGAWNGLLYWTVWTYTAPRQIIIKSATLGIMNLCFQFVIVIYIVVYVMLYKKGYLYTTPPTGTTRMTLREPDYNALLADNVTGPVVASYCTNLGATPRTGWAYPCQFQRFSQLTYPPSVGNVMSISTRTRQDYLVLPPGCDQYNASCQLNLARSELFFSAGVEYSTIFIDHSIRNVNGDIERNLANMNGVLVDADGAVVKQFSPRQPGVSSTQYILERILTVNDLLKAASGKGVRWTLDSTSDSGKDGANSLRYDGVILSVSIEYDNTKTFSQEKVEFVMEVRKLPNTEYKTEYSMTNQTDPSRLLDVSMHGVLIVVVQTGRIGQVDVTETLVQLTAALTLLAISSKIVNIVSTLMLKQRDDYHKCLFFESDELGVHFGSNRPPAIVVTSTDNFLPINPSSSSLQNDASDISGYQTVELKV
eukprot:GGOE01064636.1.p1 GENE.GGOE01064636.1~~GGOE01064636.1.p1  ORF type:complete len:426 (+),score=107.01 GGOE01064636.1:50-1327(+)